jgi:hypothetical protein
MTTGKIILLTSFVFADCGLLSHECAVLAEEPASATTQTNCPPAGPCTALPPVTECGPATDCPPSINCPPGPCEISGEPCLIEPSDTWIQPCPPLETMPMQAVPFQSAPMQLIPMQNMPSQAVPLMPLPMSASPRPAPLGAPIFAGPPPGSVILPPGTGPAVAEGPLASIAPGGAISPQFGLPAGPEPLPGIANPILVPVTDDQMAWDQIVDVTSGYFRVGRELQARRNGEIWSEGRIETLPQTGATLLEPHRSDSVGWFNLWESTFQSIRRTAVIRVIPDANGYLVEVVVQKELENLPQPERSTISAATLHNDESLPSHRITTVSHVATSPLWISLGRDPALEQRMLADIHARLTGVTTDGSVFR